MTGLPKSDPEPQILAHDEGVLAFVDEGPRQAPPLIALHGIPGSHADFRYLAPQLGAGARFIRVDLPGFGRSTLSGRDSYELRFRALLRLADHLGLATFALLGHSLGGGTALAMAASSRERVRGLALVASAGLRPHRGLGLPSRVFTLLAWALRVPLLSAPLESVLARRFTEAGFPGAFDRERLVTILGAIGATSFARLRKSVARPLPPTLLCFSRDDHLVEPPISEELARAIPGATTLVFETGGHNLQKSRAPELGAALQAWLLGLRERAIL